jgi:hypothetical protein
MEGLMAILWTTDMDDLLKKLWGEGLSESLIAKEVGGGVTKNMVHGRQWRLQLPSRTSPIVVNGKPKPALMHPASRKPLLTEEKKQARYAQAKENVKRRNKAYREKMKKVKASNVARNEKVIVLTAQDIPERAVRDFKSKNVPFIELDDGMCYSQTVTSSSGVDLYCGNDTGSSRKPFCDRCHEVIHKKGSALYHSSLEAWVQFQAYGS